jgi:excisionase family DNA binding protein
MGIEDRLRQIVMALPNEASIMLPVAVVREWLDAECDDPLADLTVAEVAAKLGRAEGTVRAWIRAGGLKAYWLGREYRVTRAALVAFRARRKDCEVATAPPVAARFAAADLGAWRKTREANR